MIERFDVLGVGVSAISMADAVTAIETWIAARSPNYVCITGVHGVMESQNDAELMEIHNRAGMVTPDGMPLVWLAHLSGRTQVERVYGPDLLLEVASLSLRKGYRHFFYGGGEGVADLLASRMRQGFSGLRIVGTHTPPFRVLSDEEDQAVVDKINGAAPDIIWVGLSTPKQEYWMARHIGRVSAPVMVGIGAAFDFHAGLKRQAPRWMQRSGLEWAFRVVTEPRRLAWRYLKNNPRFVLRVAAQGLGRHPGEADMNKAGSRSVTTPTVARPAASIVEPGRTRPSDSKVTAIITCMTDAERPFIEPALRSVVDQTFPCTTRVYVPTTNAWIDDIAERLRSVEVRRIPPLCAAAVRNLGVDEAETPYVAFLDGDDLWLPTKVELQLALLEQSPAPFVGADHVLVDETGQRFAYGTARYTPMTSSWFAQRDHMQEFRFDERITHGEDAEWWVRTFRRAPRLRLPSFLVAYRVRGVSKSSASTAKKKKLRAARLSHIPGLRPAILASSYALNRINARHDYVWHPSWTSGDIVPGYQA